MQVPEPGWRPSFGLKRVLLCSGMLILVCSPVQSQNSQENIFVRRELQALYVDAPPELDGRLEESQWKQAPIYSNFIQSEPYEGTPATEDTEVRVLYDADSIYIGVHCLDSDPDGIVLSSRRRDFDFTQTDSFGLVLSPYNDNRTGFLFSMTPEGAQRDVQVDQDGVATEASWDGVWHVKTLIHDRGWSAEIRIPFTTLHESFSDETSTWGINFNRRVRRKNETTHWSPVPRRYNLTTISYAGSMKFTKAINAGGIRNFRVKPYLLAEASRLSAELEKERRPVEAGLDVKYDLTPGLTLDLTLNTDFAQTEVDERQINLTRFSLFFPEKRDFFLENSGIFHFGVRENEKRGGRDPQDMLLFFSRRIGLSEEGRPIPILGGARLSGRAGRFRLGLMHMQTRSFQDLPSTGYSVARLKMDVFQNSDVGAMFVQRASSRPEDLNRSFGVDTNFRFYDNLTFTTYLAKSETPEVHDDDWSSKVALGWKDNFFEMRGEYLEVGENFNNEVGFTLRKGVRTGRLNWGFRPRPENSSWLREINPHGSFSYLVDPKTNELLTRRHHYGLRTSFQDGGWFEVFTNISFERLAEADEIVDIVIPPGDYSFHETATVYNSDPSKWISGSAQYRVGSFFGGRKNTQKASLTLRGSSAFSQEITFERNELTVPLGEATTRLFLTRIGYAFNTRTYLDTLLQYDNETRTYSTNVRFRFRYRPLSDIFVVYNEERPTIQNEPRSWSLTFKITRLWQY